MDNMSIGFTTRPEVKSGNFSEHSVFPRRENIDQMFKDYFTQNVDSGFVDLHHELSLKM